MTDPSLTAPAVSTTSSDSTPRRRRKWPWLIVLLLIAAAGWVGWQQWQRGLAVEQATSNATGLQLDALGQRVDLLRRNQKAQTQRLQQAVATNQVLRSELLGLAERSALIESSFARYSDPSLRGVQALRLDEAALLLGIAQQRLMIAGDLDGARRAYALAASVLDRVDDPAYLSLRQTLGQERAALDQADTEPRAAALARLDGFAQRIEATPPLQTPPSAAAAPWWKRAFGGIVEVTRNDEPITMDPADLAATETGLQLEITLARAAAERRDVEGYRSALARAGLWLDRLPAAADETRARRIALDEIAAMPLSLSLPTLGTTLNQLNQLRQSRAMHREPIE
ncbi:uroporphyrinogen-III C-methyltransferase [Lysobacter sp. A289]